MRITETTKVKKQMNIPVNDENQWLEDADIWAQNGTAVGFYLITFISLYHAIFQYYVFCGCVSRIFVLVFSLPLSFFFFFLSTNFSTNFTTRLGTSEPTIARSTWRPVFDHRTRVPASNSIEYEKNSDAGLFMNTR